MSNQKTDEEPNRPVRYADLPPEVVRSGFVPTLKTVEAAAAKTKRASRKKKKPAQQ